MTSIDMITLLASMTSTASLASRIKKILGLCLLSEIPGLRNLNSLNDLNSLNNLSGLNDLNSLISSKNLLSLMFPSYETKMTYPGLLMWDGSLKIHYFIDFWRPFSWRLWRARNIKKIKTDELGINVPIL